MVKIVAELAKDPKNVVYIMSGRTREGLDKVFGSIGNIGLWYAHLNIGLLHNAGSTHFV